MINYITLTSPSIIISLIDNKRANSLNTTTDTDDNNYDNDDFDGDDDNHNIDDDDEEDYLKLTS